jgi:2'-hydroxyisoflavone reductase
VGKGLSALQGRHWEVIVDTSGQYPRVVDASTALLQHRSAHYIMVSSISAYASFKAVGLDEGSPLRALGREYSENPDLVEGDWPTYGARKSLGEATVAQRFEGRHTIVRPGPICGGDNNDGTGAYWAERLFRDTSVLVPGRGEDPLQLIDVRDAADFIILAAEQRLQGAFNLVGPETAITVADYMAACRAAVGGRGEIVWAGDFPQELGNMPLIVPFHIAPGHATVRNTRAVAAGLRFRPLADTILSDWIDHRSRRGHLHDFSADGLGVPAAREAELIAAQLDRG